MEVKTCARCGGRISQERLKALPGTVVCVACSLERRRTEDEVDLDGPLGHDMVRAVQGVGRGE